MQSGEGAREVGVVAAVLVAGSEKPPHIGSVCRARPWSFASRFSDGARNPDTRRVIFYASRHELAHLLGMVGARGVAPP